MTPTRPEGAGLYRGSMDFNAVLTAFVGVMVPVIVLMALADMLNIASVSDLRAFPGRVRAALSSQRDN